MQRNCRKEGKEEHESKGKSETVQMQRKKGWKKRRKVPPYLLSTLPYDLTLSASPSGVYNYLSSFVCVCV